MVVFQTDPIPICQRNSAIPVGLTEVIDLTLVDKPDIYFKTAREFNADLSWAKLGNAELVGVNLTGANLDKVDLSKVDLSGVRISDGRIGE